MAADVYVNTRSAAHPGGDAVAGITVHLYTTDGEHLTSDTTDDDGNAFLGSRAAGDYEVRITTVWPVKGVSGTRKSIEVVDSDGPLYFDVLVESTGLPESGDARFCRCSGVFITSAGKPAAKARIRFEEEELPHLALHTDADVGARGIVPGSVEVVTDSTGYASVDLLRGKLYKAYAPGWHGFAWVIQVPDAPSAPLPDVLFPVVRRVEYKADGELLLPLSAPAIQVNQGGYVHLEISSVFRSGLVLPGLVDVALKADNWWMITTGNAGTGIIKITGQSPGAVKLSVVGAPKEYGMGFRTIPAATYVGDITVTVIDDPDIPNIDPPAGWNNVPDCPPPLVIDGGEF